jgi:hypothetical protein
MIEVSQNLFVGSQHDEIDIRGQAGWFVVHACNEPYHRRAVGYTTKNAPKDHHEYRLAFRRGSLSLNLEDVEDVDLIAPEIIEAALNAIHENIASYKVLVHCNLGRSRSPTIAMLYLRRHTDILGGLDYRTAVRFFRTLYPPYAPAKGIADYARTNWEAYQARPVQRAI